jgi:hypothetical protein
MEELTVEKLAEVLQETNRPLLRQVLKLLGPDRTSTILIQTLHCEANGGMLTRDGTRRRTPGGTFFQLVKERATPQERRRLFPRPVPQPGPTTDAAPATTHGTDLGGSQHPHPDPCHRTTRRGPHHETHAHR